MTEVRQRESGHSYGRVMVQSVESGQKVGGTINNYDKGRG